MAEAGFEKVRKRMLTRAQTIMESLALETRGIISVQPPKDLLGYIYAQRFLQGALAARSVDDARESPTDPESTVADQFLLEYVHACLAATPAPTDPVFDEAAVARLRDLSEALRAAAISYAVASSRATEDGLFGAATPEVEAWARSGWVLLRGHRYPVLEEEFYAYVLGPHDDVLREVYGAGSAEIAAGFQAAVTASIAGQGMAAETLDRSVQAAEAAVGGEDRPYGTGEGEPARDHAEAVREASLAFQDMVRGGICNVSRHSRLPATLLADLACCRGEDIEFFAVGALAGTPYRTLPARKKPLIDLDAAFYAVDPCSFRDAGYRALLCQLLKRRPVTSVKVVENAGMDWQPSVMRRRLLQ